MTKKPAAAGGPRFQKSVPVTVTDPEEIRRAEEASRHYRHAKRIFALSDSFTHEQRVALLLRLVPHLGEGAAYEILEEALKGAPREMLPEIEKELSPPQNGETAPSAPKP